MESAAIHSSEVHEVDSGIPMTLFKGFSTSLSLLQGELHLSHQAFSIVFTTPSVPLVGDRNLRRKDVTALRCSEPLRSKVGGASKPSPGFCGMGPPSCYGDQLAIILLKVSAWRGLAD